MSHSLWKRSIILLEKVLIQVRLRRLRRLTQFKTICYWHLVIKLVKLKEERVKPKHSINQVNVYASLQMMYNYVSSQSDHREQICDTNLLKCRKTTPTQINISLTKGAIQKLYMCLQINSTV